MQTQNNNTYQASFFVVPCHIIQLPDITLAFIKFYETIFQFWNKGLICFLSNSTIMERTGIKSMSTINEAFHFFEMHNQMRREIQNGQRYIIQPERKIKTEEIAEGGIAPAIGGYRSSDKGGIAPARHNIKNLNKETNKDLKDLVDFKKSPKSKKVNLKDYKKDPRFMRFYDPYPKKEKPREAYKAFLSIVGDDDELLERIIVDIELRKEKHEQWQDIQYISHPATYLRSEEFNGEIYDHKKRKAYNTEHQEKNKAERDKEDKEAQDALIKTQDEASRLKQQSTRTNEKRRVELSNSAENEICKIKNMII